VSLPVLAARPSERKLIGTGGLTPTARQNFPRVLLCRQPIRRTRYVTSPNGVKFITCDRYCFLTWTTYGTWLPGDERGFIGTVRDESGQRITKNEHGTPSILPNTALRQFSKQQMNGSSVVLNLSQAQRMLAQFFETTGHRGWLLVAVGVMHTHVHVVVGVPGDPAPSKILGDLKSYGSRSLNDGWSKPPSGTWWTESGSKRKFPDERSVEAAVDYIRRQPNPLVIWTREQGYVSGKPSSGDGLKSGTMSRPKPEG